MHDAFLSYATEDNDFAGEIAFGLRGNGLKVWFAPLSLRVGDRLLDSIESGLRESRAGILIVSQRFLDKHWTSFEMQTLVQQHIEAEKKILPIWLKVGRAEVERRSLALAGIVSITDTGSTNQVTSKLVEVLSDGAPSRGVIPIWEDPAHRFLEGFGEVNLGTASGPATTLFEFLLYAKDADFPFWLGGRSYTKADLLLRLANILAHDPGRMKNWVDAKGKKALRQMCLAHGIDPDDLA